MVVNYRYMRRIATSDWLMAIYHFGWPALEPVPEALYFVEPIPPMVENMTIASGLWTRQSR